MAGQADYEWPISTSPSERAREDLAKIKDPDLLAEVQRALAQDLEAQPRLPDRRHGGIEMVGAYWPQALLLSIRHPGTPIEDLEFYASYAPEEDPEDEEALPVPEKVVVLYRALTAGEIEYAMQVGREGVLYRVARVLPYSEFMKVFREQFRSIG